jgi:hypothetical protein
MWLRVRQVAGSSEHVKIVHVSIHIFHQLCHEVYFAITDTVFCIVQACNTRSPQTFVLWPAQVLIFRGLYCHFCCVIPCHFHCVIRPGIQQNHMQGVFCIFDICHSEKFTNEER